MHISEDLTYAYARSRSAKYMTQMAKQRTLGNVACKARLQDSANVHVLVVNRALLLVDKRCRLVWGSPFREFAG